MRSAIWIELAAQLQHADRRHAVVRRAEQQAHAGFEERAHFLGRQGLCTLCTDEFDRGVRFGETHGSVHRVECVAEQGRAAAPGHVHHHEAIDRRQLGGHAQKLGERHRQQPVGRFVLPQVDERRLGEVDRRGHLRKDRFAAGDLQAVEAQSRVSEKHVRSGGVAFQRREILDGGIPTGAATVSVRNGQPTSGQCPAP